MSEQPINTDSNSPQKPQRDRMSRTLSSIQGIFFFMIVMAGYLFAKGPAKTNAQFLFRVSQLTIGVVGAGVTELLKWRHRSKQRQKTQQFQEPSNQPKPKTEKIAESSLETLIQAAEKQESDVRYQVVFTGEIASGQQLEEVKTRVAALYKLPVARCERLFTGNKVTIKRELDYAMAEKYRAAFEKTGALCAIEESRRDS